MLNRVFVFFVVFALALPLAAQEPAKPPRPRQVYRLDYVIAELEGGKRVDAKDYSMQIDNDNRLGKFRVGSRVPIANSAGANPTFQYMDVGVNIDANVRDETADSIGLRTIADVSSVVIQRAESARVRAENVPENAPVAEVVIDRQQPIVRHFRGESETLVPLGKQVTLFNVDEPNSKRAFQILVTATKVK